MSFNFNKKRIIVFIFDVLMILLGTGVYAFGLYYFIEPINVAPGGVAGISIIINYLTELPVGVLNTVINIPIIIVGWKFLGKEFIWKTLLSLVSFTVFYDYLFAPITPYSEDVLLACLFGGVLIGVGLGIVFVKSGSTGGMDIINKLLNRKFQHIPLGKITLFTDLIVILISMVVFNSIETALYAIIVIFLSSQFIDIVVYGEDKGKFIYVFSSQYREISDSIVKNVGRGVTILNGEGAYTGDKKHIIACAVRNNEYQKVKRLVKEIDPKAFIVVSDTSEVVGNGFKPIDSGQ